MPDLQIKTSKLIILYSTVPLVLSFLAVLNWLFRSYTPLSGIPFFLKIAPTTAVSIWLIALLNISRSLKAERRGKRDVYILGIIFAYALSVIAAYLLDFMHHPEALMAQRESSMGGSMIGAMSPLTAFVFLLFCVSYFFLYAPGVPSRVARRVAFYASILGFVISLATFFSHASGARMILAISAVPMSLSTSFAMLVISLSFLEKAGYGIIHLQRFVSGLTMEDAGKSINQLNFIIFAFLVLALAFTAIFVVNMGNKAYKMDLREQLLQGLEARAGALNSWINQRYDLVGSVVDNSELPRGMKAVLNNDLSGQSAMYSMTWMHIVFQQNTDSRIALFDPDQNLESSAPPNPGISRDELMLARRILMSRPGPYVQDKINPNPEPDGYHQVDRLRFWTALEPGGRGPLMMLELRPDAQIAKLLGDSANIRGKLYFALIAAHPSGMHFIGRIPGGDNSALREKFLDLMSSQLERITKLSKNNSVLEAYDHRGRQTMTAFKQVEHLPWILASIVDMEQIHSNMLLRAWLLFSLSLAALFGAAMLMNYSSRKRIHLDDKEVLKQWRATFDAVPNAIWLLDDQYRIIRSNRAVFDILGYTAEDVVGKHCQDIIPAAIHYLDAVDQSGTISIDVQYRGRWLSVTGAPLVNEADERHGYVHVLSDVTSEKNSIEVLKAGEERFRAIFDQAPIGMAITSPDRRYTRSNASYQNMLGYTETELLQVSVDDVTHPDYIQMDRDGVTALMKGKISQYRAEKKFIRKDGSELWGLVTVILAHDPYSGSPFMLGMVENIHDRVHAMQELYRAKEMAVMSEKMKSGFMQNISHEFRTPLNGIMGFSDVLLQGNLDSEEVKEYAGYIKSSGKRMLQLIANIMDFAKIDSGQEAINTQPFVISQLMNKILDLYRNKAFNKGLELICSIPEHLKDSIIISDEGKLLQILVKLMDNALDFTLKGFVEFACDLNGNILILKVKDSGVGISPIYQAKIFDSFYQADMSITREHEGVGLGLPICKGLARLLGGDISLISDIDKGSQFILSVPIEFLDTDL
ncbi:MAG: PAS domain S-box protein [Candidatus Cloacimonetes bacterium]|nr:PAS domain S-box protein [Candidatus Cloacimonadota bacterium]